MLNKLKNTKLNLSVKSCAIILAFVFVVAFFCSRWIDNNTETIADSLVLHHDKKEVTEKQKKYHYDMLVKNHELLFDEAKLPMPLNSKK